MKRTDGDYLSWGQWKEGRRERRQESERRWRGECVESKMRGGEEKERLRVKAFQQTGTSIILAVAKAGISSGCTTAEVCFLTHRAPAPADAVPYLDKHPDERVTQSCGQEDNMASSTPPSNPPCGLTDRSGSFFKVRKDGWFAKRK